jgi:hypothetical protein
MNILEDQELADLCRKFSNGSISMSSILKILNLPPNRGGQACYKMLAALRRIELAKRDVVL